MSALPFDLKPRKGDILPFARLNMPKRYFIDEWGQVFIEGDVYRLANGCMATVCNHANMGMPIFQVRTPKGIAHTPAGSMNTERLTLDAPVNENALRVAFVSEWRELIGAVL